MPTYPFSSHRLPFLTFFVQFCDPIEELQDPVPALQRERALGASSGNQKARRKLRHRTPESSTSGAIDTSDCAGKH